MRPILIIVKLLKLHLEPADSKFRITAPLVVKNFGALRKSKWYGTKNVCAKFGAFSTV